MINISELGIGNIILDKTRSSYVRIAGLLKSTEEHPYIAHGINKMVGDIMVLENGDATVLNNVFGFETFYSFVPLTSEILEKAGFEWYKPLQHWRLVNYNQWYSIKNILFDEPKEELLCFSWCNLAWDEGQSMPPKVVKHLHELQNIFYIIASKELEIKDL